MENNTTEKKGLGGVVIIAVLAILAVAAIGFCIAAFGVIAAEDVVLKKGTVNDKVELILYDGPKTLPSKAEALAKFDPDLEKYKKTLARDDDTKIYVGDQQLFVYATGVAAGHTWSVDYKAPQMYTPVTYFDAEFKEGGEVTICVDITDVADIEAIESVEVLPSAYGIKPVVDGKRVYFNIKENGNYTVVFNDQEFNATHIFVNEIEDYSQYIDEDTVIIEPGEWTIENISLETGKTYYIKGGAVVHSTLGGNYVEDIKVFGHGIIDGSWYAGWKENHTTEAHVPFNVVAAQGITLDGPTFLNSNCWVVNATDSKNCVFKNIKLISGRANGDGITIQSCQDMTITDAFVRTWDDSLVVKNYTTTQNSKNINFKNISVWTDLAQSMEIGYETNKGKKEDPQISGVSFTDITVLYNFHKPVISIHNSDNAYVHDISYKNIVVEHANMGEGDGAENRQLIDFNVQSSNWSQTNERGRIKGVTIENVQVLNTNKANVISRIVGNDEEHKVEDITIKDLVILGTKVTNDNCQDAAHTFEFNDYTSNIIFE